MDIWCVEDQMLQEENELKDCTGKSLVLEFASNKVIEIMISVSFAILRDSLSMLVL